MNTSHFNQHISESLSSYKVIDSKHNMGIIGKGAISLVKLVQNQSGELLAMKMISKSELLDKTSVDQMKQEIRIHRRLSHPHIVRLKQFLEDQYFVYLIMEYCENGNLHEYLRKKKRMTEAEAFTFFFQTCLGVQYLHRHDVMHRDLKPENLLIDSRGNIKLCDFGWSTENINFKKQTFCGTLNYMAPELLQNCEYNYKVDLWGLGILLFELLHGSPPDAYQFVLSGNPPSFDERLSPEAKDLIRGLLKLQPKERMGLEEVFKHPWLKRFEAEFNIQIEDFTTKKDNNTTIRSKSSNEHRNPNPKGIRSITAITLNKYNETLFLAHNQQEKETNKEENIFDLILGAIGCVRRDKQTATKKRSII